MTLYDSSLLINYLDGDEVTVQYINDHLDERAVAPPLVMFEVYQGEVFKAGSPDFDAVESALEWVTIIDETPQLARAAAELQADLQQHGETLAARDAFIAGAAKGLNEGLAVADSDFDVEGITRLVNVDFI
ncbi:PIN domain-containing protein [Haladaptatus pallidirubidus]|uniref:PIN domain-containing protein n=1 Tax=Haladaptatus pallidirubidus TaxID=1008152 RepID=A0AAV3UP39_9EURY|nr:PIN domain-containing protein [Haladaptatus pallidirubidus]